NAKKSLAFYKAALAPLGYQALMEGDGYAGFGVAPKPDFWIGEGKPNVPAVHVAFSASSRTAVDGCTRRPSRPAAVTMARRACGRNTIRIITARSCWTRTV